jgi:hypothetical protein
MRYETGQLLRVVHGDSEGMASVREQLDSGRNFFLILPGDADAVARFCRGFDLKQDCLSTDFTRSDLLRMGQYIDDGAFNEMLAAWDAHERVVFLEQIDFPMNQPPHVKPFLVYSPVWGILSQHDELQAARRGLEEVEHWEERSRLAQPAIYKWERSGWKML